MYKSRLDHIPTLKTVPTTMDAHRYNLVRLALLRLEDPLRVEIPGLRSMDVILEDKLVVIVDRALNDVPVAAWTDFEHRAAIHAPVKCKLRYYHAHADIIINTALETLDKLLTQRLAPAC